MKKLLLLCAALALLTTACARQPQLGTPADPAAADAVWSRYVAYDEARQSDRPYRIQASLRYGSEGDSRRVMVLLWGNGAESLRLDVMAGVGVTVAKILEEGEHFLVYAPNENKAYFHQGAAKPLLNMGVPVPFGVGDLAAALNGRFARLFGVTRSGEALLRPDGNILYPVDTTRLKGSLELNPQGLPVLWKQSGSDPWEIRISYDDAVPPLPRRLDIQHAQGKKAVLLVKERQFPTAPFTEAQMRLILPEDTPLLPLQQLRK